MPRTTLLFSVVATLALSGCKKDVPVETVPPDVLDPSLKKPEPEDTATKDAVEASRKSVVAETKRYPDKVRPPLAEDLSHYVGDLGTAGSLVAVIETSMGEIRCELYEDKTPMTVANFVGLARGLKPFLDAGQPTARPFYDGLIFHRVLPTFMIQGGDPVGNGSGGPGYKFRNEINGLARHDGPGTLAMANSGPDTNGSQFYITEDARSQLDDSYTVFGRCKNIGVVRDIARVPRDDTDRPNEPVTIKRVSIIRGEI